MDEHVPVLLAEVKSWLMPALAEGGVLVDCTVGGGGHAEALLDSSPRLRLVGIDRDPEALEVTERRLRGFGGRVVLVRRGFAKLSMVIEELGMGSVQGVLYDLGVSSLQLERPERGFRYRDPSPLDMRMDRSEPLSAADVVNGYSEDRLAKLLADFGEERFAARIARAIVRRRERQPFLGGEDLASVIIEAIPAATRRRGPHPARRTFQALRIEVNQELDQLRASLPQATESLAPAGRLAVISYHSLEDRIVKRALAEEARGCRCPVSFPICVCGAQARLRLLTARPTLPTPAEVGTNPRSRSARLRVAERLAPPAPGPEGAPEAA
ncbi:MAG: 16S rRNA (cytosine(1402)-N(4))-methyltransferase RsmH [Actinomycetota bacterium]